MNVTVKWLDNACVVGESGSGHSVVMDGSEEIGGRNIGIRPMEMVLLGLGGCAAMDILNILKKSRQDLRACEIQVNAKRADSDPKVFTNIHLHFILNGHALKEAQVKRAVDLSAEKYCSVSHMLAKTAVITHDYEIVPS
jgi:putative redox protein